MSRPRVVVVLSDTYRTTYLDVADVERLRLWANVEILEMEEGGDATQLLEELPDTDALIVCHGAPRIAAAHLDQAPHLVFIGELEGDRFGQRIDIETAVARGIRVVDTTQGSSYPVAEWALALMLMSLRNAAPLYRRLIAHEETRQDNSDFGYIHGELTGKRVGLIGCGHIGRRLIEFLRPFQVDVRVYDPYLAPEMADAVGFLLTTLEFVLARSDVVVCLAPLTPRTRGMLGKNEFAMLAPGAAFVNVSRGPIVDSAALIERLRKGDVTAALDVFDPEPIPVDSPIRDLPNVFLSPHIAGVTAASRPRFFTLMVDELVRFFQGHATKFDLNARALANRRGDEPPAR